MQALSQLDNAAVRQFFDGPRARAAHEQHELNEKQDANPAPSHSASKPRARSEAMDDTDAKRSSSKPK
jgi:hypothetical protein